MRCGLKNLPKGHFKASWCHNSDPKGQIFLSAPNNDRFFFLHTFWSPAFDFNVGVAIKESGSYMLTPAILQVDSTPNIFSYVSSSTISVLITHVVILFLSIPRVG